MKRLAIALALILMSVPVMAEVPNFNEGWDIVHMEHGANGAIGATLVNQDQTAKWRAAVIIAVPQDGGYIPFIVVLYDGCHMVRYVLKENGYEIVPLDPEAEQNLKRHLNTFVAKRENV